VEAPRLSKKVVVLTGFVLGCTLYAGARVPGDDGTAFSAWFLAIFTLLMSIPNAFGSKETLARNSKLIGTENLVVARILSVIGVLAGCMLVLVAVYFTHSAKAVFSAGGLLAALAATFFAYSYARTKAAKSAKENEERSL
jgi:hypothetical protein